jgi:branched-chain amino acid transport system substrate-binding protein
LSFRFSIQIPPSSSAPLRLCGERKRNHRDTEWNGGKRSNSNRKSILALFIIFSACHREPQTTTRIGLIAGFSGPTAAWGTAIRRGAEMAIDDAHERGERVELVIEDDQAKPEQSALIAEELMTRDGVVAVVGGETSGKALSIAPLADRNRVTLVSPTASAPVVTRGHHYVFRVCATDDLEALAIANVAREQLHARRAVILRDTKNDYSVGIAETFVRVFGPVAGMFDYGEGDNDFHGQLTSAKALAPDVIVIPGYYSDVAQIAIQARDLGITTPLLGGSGWDSPKLVEIGGRAVEGGTFASGLRSASPRFVERFRKRYGVEPDAANAESYDAVSLVCAAVKKAGNDRQRVRDAIASTRDFSGASGMITIGKDGNAEKPLGVFKVENGRFIQHSTSNIRHSP